MFHPASLLLAWGAGVFALQQLDLRGIAGMAALALVAAVWVNAGMLLIMVRRVRWLLASVVILFLWMTPGVFVSGVLGKLGITVEGAWAALEHLLRLLAIIALLALLLARLSADSIVAGLYTLLAPWVPFGLERRSLAVRLMLTLEYVAEEGHRGWRELFLANKTEESGCVRLPRSAWRLGDGLFLGVVILLVLSLGWP
ncbi:CbiQ family ECF transporter T component [Denitratisoma oestradiolicum]|uniref:Cobalt transport protein n=1 Tax=Denitratisoma oestradiolicum TaxID=311182 RepID=A0A6S6XV36_9PROT|nr:CbiQ family ECF transporter T component [Denitratisoma oestradiolicum]TWO81208.1 hypothetical protein CBW56_06315 [Denitratisoma oestradiolicum]CAB1367907.1 conserved membrane protein of unknown function [Denitratisoma oestradiolicum]